MTLTSYTSNPALYAFNTLTNKAFILTLVSNTLNGLIPHFYSFNILMSEVPTSMSNPLSGIGLIGKVGKVKNSR
jgi:hypothetical protein